MAVHSASCPEGYYQILVLAKSHLPLNRGHPKWWLRIRESTRKFARNIQVLGLFWCPEICETSHSPRTAHTLQLTWSNFHPGCLSPSDKLRWIKFPKRHVGVISCCGKVQDPETNKMIRFFSKKGNFVSFPCVKTKSLVGMKTKKLNELTEKLYVWRKFTAGFQPSNLPRFGRHCFTATTCRV